MQWHARARSSGWPFIRRNVLLSVAILSIAAAVVLLRPHPTPGPIMRDFESYYAAGGTWLRGEDPYGVAVWQAEKQVPGVVASRRELLPFVGPAPFLPLWAVFARFPFSIAAPLWGIVLVASLTFTVAATLHLSRERVTGAMLVGVFAIAVGFAPITGDLALGQAALPAFACALLALLTLERRRIAAAIPAFFSAIQPNVGALVLLSQLGRLRAVVAFGAAAIVFIAASMLVVGPHSALAYVALLAVHGAAEGFSAIQITPAAIAYGFGAPASVAHLTGIIFAVAATIVWIIGSLRLRDNDARFLFACAILPLAAPFFHEHDLLIAFVPAVYGVMRSDKRLAPVALCAALFVAVDWLGLAQRPDGVAQSFFLVFGALLAYAALRDDLSWRSYFLPALPLALLLIAGFFTGSDPVPIWPNDMHAVGLSMANASAARMWEAEQRATGLFHPNALWALLRCGALAGCALLAFVIFRCRHSSYCRTASRRLDRSS